MRILTAGIDLAKNVFAVHGVDDNGKPVLVKPKLARADLVALIIQLPPCLIGMEACSGAHHWARLFRQHGHTVRLMAPKFVTPYRMSGKRGKNDAAKAPARRMDRRATACHACTPCTAVVSGRPGLRRNVHAPSRPMACADQSTAASAAPIVSKMRAISRGSTISGGDRAMMSPV